MSVLKVLHSTSVTLEEIRYRDSCEISGLPQDTTSVVQVYDLPTPRPLCATVLQVGSGTCVAFIDPTTREVVHLCEDRFMDLLWKASIIDNRYIVMWGADSDDLIHCAVGSFCFYDIERNLSCYLSLGQGVVNVRLPSIEQIGDEKYLNFPAGVTDDCYDDEGEPHLFKVNVDALTIELIESIQETQNSDPLSELQMHPEPTSLIPIRKVKIGVNSVVLSPSHLVVARSREFDLYVDGLLKSKAVFVGPPHSFRVQFISTMYPSRGLLIVVTHSFALVLKISEGDEISILSRYDLPEKGCEPVPWTENAIALWKSPRLRVFKVSDTGDVGQIKMWTLTGTTNFKKFTANALGVKDGVETSIPHQFACEMATKGRIYLMDSINVYRLRAEDMDEGNSKLSAPDWVFCQRNEIPTEKCHPKVLELEKTTLLYCLQNNTLRLTEITNGDPVFSQEDSSRIKSGSEEIFQSIFCIPGTFGKFRNVLAIDYLPGIFICSGTSRPCVVDIRAKSIAPIFQYYGIFLKFAFPMVNGILHKRWKGVMFHPKGYRLVITWDRRKFESLPTPIKEVVKPIYFAHRFRQENVWAKLPAELLDKILAVVTNDWPSGNQNTRV